MTLPSSARPFSKRAIVARVAGCSSSVTRFSVRLFGISFSLRISHECGEVGDMPVDSLHQLQRTLRAELVELRLARGFQVFAESNCAIAEALGDSGGDGLGRGSQSRAVDSTLRFEKMQQATLRA